MDLHLVWLTPDRFDDYVEFNQQIYPHRPRFARRFQLQVLDNPFLADKTRPAVLLSCTEAGKIVGLYGLNVCRFHEGGRERTGYSGFDFFVLPDYRKGGTGRQLAHEALSQEPYFGIGATPVAEHIYLKLGATTAGHMFRYFWLRGPLQTLFLGGEAALKQRWFRKPERVGDAGRLPERVRAGGISFARQSQADGWEDRPWSDEVISFSRSAEFLNYRFFAHPEHYHVYAPAGADGSTYFVVRRYHWRGLALLCLVDYRMPQDDDAAFDAVLAAAKALARAGGFDGAVVYSSLHFVDDRLTAAGFRRIGQPTIVVAKGDLPMNEQRIADRAEIFVTLADCDQDFAIYD